jgi:hypothetical protein
MKLRAIEYALFMTLSAKFLGALPQIDVIPILMVYIFSKMFCQIFTPEGA